MVVSFGTWVLQRQSRPGSPLARPGSCLGAGFRLAAWLDSLRLWRPCFGNLLQFRATWTRVRRACDQGESTACCLSDLRQLLLDLRAARAILRLAQSDYVKPTWGRACGGGADHFSQYRIAFAH